MYTQEWKPLDWAMTQNNLGIALWRLGDRESGTRRLEEAVSAYRESPKERTRDRVPLQRAKTQRNLSLALWRLGERKNGTARVEEARQALELAWHVYREAGIDRYDSIFETPLRSLNALIASRRSSPQREDDRKPLSG
jgi:tetratricopeptide (TPR) repeat protein